MRIFIALELSEEFAFQTAELARTLSQAVKGRFLPRDAYHVTLAFIGNAGEREVAGAMAAMDEACMPNSVEKGSRLPISLEPDSIGKFGRSSDATLWMGLSKSEGIMQIAQDIREGLRLHDVPFDDKAFLPHITLARRASIPKGGLPPLVFPAAAPAKAVTLFKSELSREGAKYTLIYSVELPQR